MMATLSSEYEDAHAAEKEVRKTMTVWTSQKNLWI